MRIWIIDSFVWWRGNHSMSFLSSVWMAIKMDIFNPIYGIYCWFMLKTVDRYRIKKMLKIEKELDRKNITHHSTRPKEALRHRRKSDINGC